MEKYKINVNGKEYLVTVEVVDDNNKPPLLDANNSTKTRDHQVHAPMQGNVIKVNVALGQKVEKDDTLIILEAMKMENKLIAPVSGVISSINIKEGDILNSGAIILSIKES